MTRESLGRIVLMILLGIEPSQNLENCIVTCKFD
jgi:hypothetical protein